MKILSGEQAARAMEGHDDQLTELIEALEMGVVGKVEEQAIARFRGRAQTLLSNNSVTIASVDNKAVAMSGHQYRGIWEGRPLYELRSVVTLPSHEGQGLSSQVQNRCMQEVLDANQNAIFATFTKNPTLVEWAKARNAQELDLRNYFLFLSGGSLTPEQEEDYQADLKEGYRVFLLDPKRFPPAKALHPRK